MENADATKEDIASTLTGIPCQLTAADINDFFSLAQYYASKTPQSFRKVSLMASQEFGRILCLLTGWFAV